VLTTEGSYGFRIIEPPTSGRTAQATTMKQERFVSSKDVDAGSKTDPIMTWTVPTGQAWTRRFSMAGRTLNRRGKNKAPDWRCHRQNKCVRSAP
jgi:hypothetical protein